jgi:hypothetical protein
MSRDKIKTEIKAKNEKKKTNRNKRNGVTNYNTN